MLRISMTSLLVRVAVLVEDSLEERKPLTNYTSKVLQSYFKVAVGTQYSFQS